MQNEVREAILRYLDEVKPGKILDIPSGSCWLYRELTSPGWEYYAADLFVSAHIPSYQMVDLNKHLPYDNEYFDYVACLEGLEHIENYHHVLREFFRILRKGGSLLISTPNPLNMKNRIRFFLFGTFRGFPHLTRMPPEGQHLHMSPINLSFLIAFANKYGFELDQVCAVRVKAKMYRFIVNCWILKLYTFVKLLLKDADVKMFMSRLVTLNILLNDGIVVSFRKT